MSVLNYWNEYSSLAWAINEELIPVWPASIDSESEVAAKVSDLLQIMWHNGFKDCKMWTSACAYLCFFQFLTIGAFRG